MAGGSATVLQGLGRTAATLFDSYTVSDLSYEVAQGHRLTREDGVNLAMSVGGFGVIGKAGKGFKAAEELADAEKGAEAERTAAASRRSFSIERLAQKSERSRLAKAIVERARELAAARGDNDVVVDTIRFFDEGTCREEFRSLHPGLDFGQVHHRIEQ